MIDSTYKVRRYISEFCNHSDQLLAEYDLRSFDLHKFQNEFGVIDMKNPMFDCYPLHWSNIPFMKAYLSLEPEWDFVNKSYFVESQSIEEQN
ncbi:hypothetical protein CW740_01050 [Kangiella profundi]|uniref:DUF7683 domain-containing protein n=1 Tax=Kangiella profundi TaxID=1561924 RepID=A0A2K9A908_9GAMM|nr:hypothetical protein CW740_01050 [Kangiella profundi]GGE91610.1 hypothetical protein GCM10011356_02170 [Kangiella profundi]